MANTNLPYTADAGKNFATVTDGSAVHTQQMALALNDAGTPVPLAPGRASAANSVPTALSTEDKAALDLVATAANQASEIAALGAPADAAAPTGNGSLVALTKAMRDFLASLESTDYAPGYNLGDQGGSRMATDPDGNLRSRSQVLTDEGTFRVNFANSSLAVSLGTVTLTNGSAAVTWSLTATTDIHAGDYIKLDADAESAWAQIESIDSLAGGTLVTAYAGTGGTGAASRALVRPYTGTGGSISVASGILTIASGTTNSAITGVSRVADYAPLVYRARVAISARNANQEIHIGLEEDAATTRWFARFLADGTTATTIKFETGRNPTGTPSASETETTTLTLPGGQTTVAMQEYRIEVLTERVVAYINGIMVASHSRVIPAQHDEMTAHVEVRNGTGASACSVTVDYLTSKNHNKVEVGLLSDTEQVVAVTQPASLFAYNVAGVIAINTDLIVIDCAQFRSLSIHSVSMGTSGVVTAAWSNDPGFANPITATLYDQAGVTNTTFNAGSLLRMTNVLARYFRLRLTTATTAGTTTINVQAFQQQLAPPVATQPVSGTVGVTTTRLAANAADGAGTTHHLISAASTNATSVKASSGQILCIQISNVSAAVRFFKLYNKASAPTVGTDTPIMTIAVAAGATETLNFGAPGIRPGTGIAYALTTGIAVADTGAVAANDISVSIWYS